MKYIKFLIVCFLIVCFTNTYGQMSSQAIGASRKFQSLIDLIDKMYVDTVKFDSLVEEAIVSMLHKMDPHSVYISAKELERFKEPLEGSFEGIGVTFRLSKDTVIISDVISGGPSEKLGILAGDRIIKVNDSIIAGIGIKQNDVPKLLRGKKGTIVKVSIKRGTGKELIDFNIIRDKIPLYSVDAAYVTKDNIGYIKLNKFAKTTTEELDTVFNYFQKNKVKDIILDLTGNGGGYLDKAVELCNNFLRKKNLIVYTQGIHQQKINYDLTTDGKFLDGKLVVMVDEGSASASEIVSGAIQDWDRGLVVGRRTFGKGLVQQERLLTDGSAVRLTIARYYTPAGRCIQKPYSEGYSDYEEDILHRIKQGELYNKDSIHIEKNNKFKTLKFEKDVYDGGGIMPDVFVPLDTNLMSMLHSQISRKNVLFTFVSNYVDKNRAELKTEYKVFEIFEKSFDINENIQKELFEAAKLEKINVDSLSQKMTSEQLRYLKNHVKALIADELFNKNAFYKIINNYNPTFRKAQELILNNKEYDKILKGK